MLLVFPMDPSPRKLLEALAKLDLRPLAPRCTPLLLTLLDREEFASRSQGQEEVQRVVC